MLGRRCGTGAGGGGVEGEGGYRIYSVGDRDLPPGALLDSQ